MSERPAQASAAGALFAALAMGCAVWAALLWSSVHKDPGVGGWLTGLFAGGFAGLIVTGMGAWLVMTYVVGTARKADHKAAEIPVDDEMAGVLAELEVARLRTVQAVNAGAVWRIPLTMTGALILWTGGQFTDEGTDLFDLLMLLTFGVVGGYFWASIELSTAYRQRYKEQVLPRLAAGFGKLAWRVAEPPLVELGRHRLFPDWDDCDADDEIYGEYRGLPLSIIEMKLTKGSGDDKRTVFSGLTCSVTLPRGLSGTTVVVPDRGILGNMSERLRGGPCQPVRLEDPGLRESLRSIWIGPDLGPRPADPGLHDTVHGAGGLRPLRRPGRPHPGQPAADGAGRPGPRPVRAPQLPQARSGSRGAGPAPRRYRRRAQGGRRRHRPRSGRGGCSPARNVRSLNDVRQNASTLSGEHFRRKSSELCLLGRVAAFSQK